MTSTTARRCEECGKTVKEWARRCDRCGAPAAIGALDRKRGLGRKLLRSYTWLAARAGVLS